MSEVLSEENCATNDDFIALMRGIVKDLDLSVLVALVGGFCAVLSYFLDRGMTRRQERRARELELIERQLRDLYGPLFATTSSSKALYKAFVSHSKGMETGSFRTDAFRRGTATKELVTLHRLWIRTVYVPIWDEMETCIRSNGDLVIESTFPPAFVAILTHLASWRLLVGTWGSEDELSRRSERTLERNFASVLFPPAFAEYVAENYVLLRARQATLLSELRE